jgi:hypothetical protein
VDEVYVPIETIADKFSVSKMTIRKWVQAGAISKNSYIKVGKTYRFLFSSVLFDIQATESNGSIDNSKLNTEKDKDTSMVDSVSQDEFGVGRSTDWMEICKNLFWQFKLYESLIDKLLKKDFVSLNYVDEMTNAFRNNSSNEYEPWIAESIRNLLHLQTTIDYGSLHKLNTDEVEDILVKTREIFGALADLELELNSYTKMQSNMLRNVSRLSDFFNEEIADRAFCNGSPDTWEEFLEDSPNGLILDDSWQDSFESFIDELPLSL